MPCDARWFEVDEDIAASVTHFGNAVRLHNAGGFSGDDLESYKSSMALMHAMQAGHTSLESALIRVLALLGEEPPAGGDWHADLIRRATRAVGGRPAILPSALAAAADETRRFRHVAVRNYGQFNVQRAEPAITAARLLAAGLVSALASFRAATDIAG